MQIPRTEHREICSFTSKEWTGRPADGAGAMFGGFSIVGFVLCLILMLFVPGLRDVGATMLFVGIFASTFTVLGILGTGSSERAFLQRLTAAVNEVILELTADRANQLSTDELRSLLVDGGSLPRLVNGVSGLHLKVIPEPTPKPKPKQIAPPKTDAVTTTRIVIAGTPPDYGIGSFDRLLETATNDPGFNSSAT
ncbi:hypothetical protein B1A87_012970 [Arthrobacter sp. KBS0703]|uniref:hypothetical protein n=1 Tax=Arthrobacter sp. KBS0703 TaxID=1955698 RepID=UPI00098EC2C6|nr:hypothetical protein [Arthrobacter sp. KBS0703]TSE16626.1 hypothetical protein B1A87_012970 [Arthrobacter sp. KBS0703]